MTTITRYGMITTYPQVPTIIFFEEGKVCKRLDGKLGIGLSEGQFKTWIEEFKQP